MIWVWMKDKIDMINVGECQAGEPGGWMETVDLPHTVLDPPLRWASAGVTNG